MDYVGFGLLMAVVFGGAFLLFRLLGRAQEGDPRQRGQDSAEPGGYYTDTHTGGSD